MRKQAEQIVKLGSAEKKAGYRDWETKEKEIGKIFDELVSLGFSDFKELMEYKDGNLTLKDFDKIDTRCIKKIKVREERATSKKTDETYTVSYITEIELHDKKGALAELGDILNLKKKQVELLGNQPIKIIVEGIEPESDKQ